MASIQSQITNKRSFYQGGKKTIANRDFWNGTADFETIAEPDRDTMRARARWLHENNPIMSNIDGAIVNNVVGMGIGLQYDIGTKRVNKLINKAFAQWAGNRKKCDATQRQNFSDIQRAVLQSRMVDGEIFIHKQIAPEGLKLRIIEADSLDRGQDGGLEKDIYGVVTTYRFIDDDRNIIRIPAENIINYYRSERPTQYRGVTEYKQAIVDIKNFSAFQTATIEAARARANIGYMVTTEAGAPTFGGTTIDGEQVQEVEGVTVQYLKPGETITKLDPANAGSDYSTFSETTIRLIATARKVSYELAFKDYSKVNYASGRASLLQDYKRFDYEQAHLIEYFLNEVFEAWLDVEVMAGRIKLPAAKYFENKDDFLDVRWVLPKRDWVDPLKDITAVEKEIALGLTTASDAAASRGESYEANMIKKKEELELQKTHGVYDEMHPAEVESTSTKEEDDDGKD